MENTYESEEINQVKREIRKNTNKIVRGVLRYECIMFLTIILYMTLRMFIAVVNGMNLENDVAVDQILNKAENSGVAYIVTIFAGLLMLHRYFRKCDYRKYIFQEQEKLSGISFLMLLTVFMSMQVTFNVIGMGAEVGLNHFGYSIQEDIESATSISNNISMFLYASFLGPIVEEIVFRGFVMRGFQKYGTGYSIIMSGVLFGAFHGNLIQGVFATFVGFILGYMASKYSIKWSIILHIINNFIFGDLLYWLIRGLNDSVQTIIFYTIEGLFFAGMIALVIRKRTKIGDLIREIKVKKGLMSITLTSKWMLLFLAFQLLLGISGIEKLSH